MIQITPEEKKVLSQVVSGVDLTKVRLVSGPFASAICSVFGGWEVTIGRNIFVAKRDAMIRPNPPGHPIRMSRLAHEVLHVKQQQDKGTMKCLLTYVYHQVPLIGRAVLAGQISPKKMTRFTAKRHPHEVPAYALEREYQQAHWVEGHEKVACASCLRPEVN